MSHIRSAPVALFCENSEKESAHAYETFLPKSRAFALAWSIDVGGFWRWGIPKFMTWMQGGARVYENLYVGVSKEMGVFTGKKCRPTPPTHGNVIKLVGG